MKKMLLVALLTAVASVMACSSAPSRSNADTGTAGEAASQPASKGTALARAPGPGLAVATFAGGCFWCMEPPFEKLDGVKEAYSGYTGGPEAGPTYNEVARGRTGHTEAVRVVYDPKVVTYERLLDVFWRSMDPTDLGGQFVDRGSQYRPGIFVHDEAQRKAAESSKAALQGADRFDAPIVVPIAKAGDFWLAEGYHQDFYKKDERHYKRYSKGSGRVAFLERVWGAQK